jgi:hypothetical protein
MSLVNRFIFLMLLLMSWSSYSSPMPTPLSAITLHMACKEAKTREYARGFCDGAIDAAYSSIQNWCVPEHVTHGQVKEYIQSELIKETPAVWLNFNKFVVDAISYKWPCKTDN